MRTMVGRLVAATLLLASGAVSAPAAEEEGTKVTVEEVLRRMDEMQRKHDEEIRALRGEVEALRARGREKGGGAGASPEGGFPEDLEEVLDEYLDRLSRVEKEVALAGQPKAAVRLIDISLDGLFTVGASTATDDQLADLQGGGHDPHRRGFTVQNVELSLLGAVDPYLTAEAHIVHTIDPEGESVVELEEAFLTTTSLPWSLQAKVGQFFTQFGRLNATHPHTWDFVDQPVVNTRMFGGDGMRGPGASLSWLAPTDFALEVIGDVHDANGETMASFEGPPGEPLVGGRPEAGAGARSLGDLVWTPRARASFDLSPTTVLMPGVSSSFGPNGTGGGGRTRILGADLTLKWKAAAADAGFPNFTWQTEYMARRYDADAGTDPVSGGPLPETVLRDAGLYSQVTWGFRRGWTLGLRGDWAEGHGGDPGADPLRDQRTRGAVALTWYPSHFSKVRLQVDRDRSGLLGGSATSVWLQFEFLLGAHGAHSF